MNRLIAIIISSFVFSGGFLALNNREYIEVSSCQPYNVFVEKGSDIYLSWETMKKCSGYVKYGSDINNLQFTSVNSDGSVSANKHRVLLKEVNNEVLYIIVSDGTEYGINGLPLYVD